LRRQPTHRSAQQNAAAMQVVPGSWTRRPFRSALCGRAKPVRQSRQQRRHPGSGHAPPKAERGGIKWDAAQKVSK